MYLAQAQDNKSEKEEPESVCDPIGRFHEREEAEVRSRNEIAYWRNDENTALLRCT